MYQLCWDNPNISVVLNALFSAWWFIYVDDATKCPSVSWKQFIKYKFLLNWYKLNMFLAARNVYLRSNFITNRRTAVVMHIQYLNNKLFILIIFVYWNITIIAMARNGIVRIYVGMSIEHTNLYFWWYEWFLEPHRNTNTHRTRAIQHMK